MGDQLITTDYLSPVDHTRGERERLLLIGPPSLLGFVRMRFARVPVLSCPELRVRALDYGVAICPMALGPGRYRHSSHKCSSFFTCTLYAT